MFCSIQRKYTKKKNVKIHRKLLRCLNRIQRRKGENSQRIIEMYCGFAVTSLSPWNKFPIPCSSPFPTLHYATVYCTMPFLCARCRALIYTALYCAVLHCCQVQFCLYIDLTTFKFLLTIKHTQMLFTILKEHCALCI